MPRDYARNKRSRYILEDIFHPKFVGPVVAGYTDTKGHTYCRRWEGNAMLPFLIDQARARDLSCTRPRRAAGVWDGGQSPWFEERQIKALDWADLRGQLHSVTDLQDHHEICSDTSRLTPESFDTLLPTSFCLGQPHSFL